MYSLPAGLPETTVNYCNSFENRRLLIRELNINNPETALHINNLRNAILNDQAWSTNPLNRPLYNRVMTITGTLNSHYSLPLEDLNLNNNPTKEEGNIENDIND